LFSYNFVTPKLTDLDCFVAMSMIVDEEDEEEGSLRGERSLVGDEEDEEDEEEGSLEKGRSLVDDEEDEEDEEEGSLEEGSL
jgi:hypothetical protein